MQQLRNINKIGVVLRFIGLIFFVTGVTGLLIGTYGLFSDGISDISFALYLWLPSIYSIIFAGLIFRKTLESLRIAQISNIIAGSLLIFTIVFVTRDGYGFSHPKFILLYIPFYIPIVTIFHWFITQEMKKMNNKKLSPGELFIPGVVIIGTYIISLAIFGRL